MSIPARLAAYVLGLVAVFGAAAGVGSLVGPIGPAGGEAPHPSAPGDGSPHDGRGGTDAEEIPGGLMVSRSGYTLAVDARSLPAGAAVPVRFRILGPDGAPVTAYERAHDKDLHLIAVRRDMTGFQHVHPVLDSDGAWRAALALEPGEWRLFADFAPAGHGDGMTLGADLSVPGGYEPRPLPGPSATAEVDGYTVTLDGALVPGTESELTLSVSRAGVPVTDLQPYLAAYGHLVALRDGDLAYLHVHPAGHPGDGRTAPGPDVTFYAGVPSAGDYRLFLDFQHDGVVRTAEFTARAREHR